jgi:hypothetical protein
MTDSTDFEPGVPPEERARLAEVADQLERSRPVPRPAFRGDLRRLLADGRRGSVATTASRWRVLVGAYSGLGALLLAVAAIGLAGAGPFGA